MERTPLNGTKTHPLSYHAREVLRSIGAKGIPTQQINAGVINRLLREELIKIGEAPSPYKTHKGKPIPHAFLTDAGVKEASS